MSTGAVRTGIAMLRAGRPVRIVSPSPVAVLAVETATQELLSLLDADHAGRDCWGQHETGRGDDRNQLGSLTLRDSKQVQLLLLWI